jgi:3-hydroxyisobutyrate dehydrogenase-like beta-hydroxyacid dehydrogenase
VTQQVTIGFIGLGVMGEPMCRNLARKSGAPVIALDLRPEPLEQLGADGVEPAASVRELMERAAVVMLSLPSGSEVEAICAGEGGLVALSRRGQVVIDLGTSPVKLMRSLAEKFGKRGVDFADAPVARTRAAAEAGTLSVMVGANEATFRRIEPLLAAFATEITHCGEVGAGQLTKILNNMVLFETGVALAEALALARSASLDPALLLATLAKGSADSFALRNHGVKAMLPGNFPERAFSAQYALKDVSYALECAAETGLKLPGAELARARLAQAIAQGFGEQYWPVIAKVIAEGT